MKAVPLIGIARHRLTIDGEGVTTLVAFHGCPLRCKYCLNPTSLQPNGVWESYNCNQLYEEVRKDELYFLASCGTLREVSTVILHSGPQSWRNCLINSLCNKGSPPPNVTPPQLARK